jgi:hypothetical protein
MLVGYAIEIRQRLPHHAELGLAVQLEQPCTAASGGSEG